MVTIIASFLFIYFLVFLFCVWGGGGWFREERAESTTQLYLPTGCSTSSIAMIPLQQNVFVVDVILLAFLD